MCWVLTVNWLSAKLLVREKENGLPDWVAHFLICFFQQNPLGKADSLRRTNVSACAALCADIGVD